MNPLDADRELYWRRKLRRLRFGAEPIEEQLARLRAVANALTAISMGIGLMFLAIFAAFARADVGAVVAGILIVPVVGLAWLDYGILRSRASAYLRERGGRPSNENPPG